MMQTKIGMTEAVQCARAGFASLVGVPGPASVEEVELAPDGSAWNVTLGYSEDDPPTADAPRNELVRGVWPLRRYKVFRIDATDGAMLSMKIRER